MYYHKHIPISIYIYLFFFVGMLSDFFQDKNVFPVTHYTKYYCNKYGRFFPT